MPASPSPSIPLRAHLGAALQKHRLRHGLTQGQVAEAADLSLKYVGEVERGEANTTLDVIERIAEAVGWDPLAALESMREPITEGVRRLLVKELQQTGTRLDDMEKWLTALDPRQQSTTTKSPVPTRGRARPHGRRRLKGGAR